MGQELTKWSVAVGMAVLVHAGAFVLWQWGDPIQATDAGGGGVHIALAPSRVLADRSVDDQAETEVAESREPVPDIVEPEEVPVIAPARPEERERVEVAERPKEPSSPATSASPPASTSLDASNISTGRAVGDAGVGDADAKADYLARIADRLARHKQYPKTARRRGAQGVAELSFTLARDGSLVASRITVSSGYLILDREVEKTLQRALPFPAFPAELQGEVLDIIVPVRFELRQD